MDNQVQRTDVSHNEMEALPYIIAVDFDGTLVEDKFPQIGAMNKDVWNDVLRVKRNGAKVILWTCRDGVNLEEAVEFCASNGLFFDAVNTNIDETKKLFSNDTRKVYANEYWDDKAVMWYSRLEESNETYIKTQRFKIAMNKGVQYETT